MQKQIMIPVLLSAVLLFACQDRKDIKSLFRETERLEDRIYSCADDIARYKSNCEAILKAFPRSDYTPAALYKLAKLNEMFGHYEEALDNYMKLQNYFPEYEQCPSALFQSAVIYHRHLNNPALAADMYEKLVRLFPDNDLAAQALIELGQLAGTWEKASGYFDEVLDSYSDHPLCDDLYFRSAEIYQLKLQNADEARNRYESLIRLYPESIWTKYAQLRLNEMAEGGE